MQTAACSNCRSPLPAVPPDPQRPDLCAVCAAAGMGMAAPVPSAAAAPPPLPGRPVAGPLVVKARPLEGLLTGLAAATIAGGIWWGVCTVTGRSIGYVALVVGFLIGQGVIEGIRRPGIVAGVLAIVLCAGAIVVSQYFIQRSLAISTAADAGVSLDLPLWQDFSVAKEVVTSSYEEDTVQLAFAGAAVVAAVVTAANPGRRPVLG